MKSNIGIIICTSFFFASSALAQQQQQVQPINNYYNSYPNPYNDVPSLVPSNLTNSVQSFIPLNQTNTVTSLVPSSQTSSVSSIIPTTTSSNLPPLTFPNQSSSFNPETTTLQQLYPQPAVPGNQAPYNQNIGQSFTPIQLPVAPYQTIAPPDSITPGLLTIRHGKWMISDFFYDITPNIGVKVEVIKPRDKYVPVNPELLEGQISDIFQDNGISPTPLTISCVPPLPLYHVLIMAYPWEDRCVAFISCELYEEGRPRRIEEDLNGVWQVITWEKQTLIACACDELTQELERVLKDITNDFADRFRYYHPQPIRKCFPEEADEGIRRKNAWENATPVQLRVGVSKPISIIPEAKAPQPKGFGSTGAGGGTTGGGSVGGGSSLGGY